MHKIYVFLQVEQLHKIFKLCGSPSEEYWKKSKLPHATIFKPQQPYKCCISETFKDFSPSALSLLHTLLAIEPKDRGTATSAMKSEVSLILVQSAYLVVLLLFTFNSCLMSYLMLFFFFSSSSLQNLMPVILPVFLSILQARKWMRNNVMKRIGGIDSKITYAI